MLLGEYHLSLDRAGCLCLPSSIRHALRELYAPDDTALILTTFFEGCLVCYPVVEWYKAPERLRRRALCVQVHDGLPSQDTLGRCADERVVYLQFGGSRQPALNSTPHFSAALYLQPVLSAVHEP